jgi:hypothetical protein
MLMPNPLVVSSRLGPNVLKYFVKSDFHVGDSLLSPGM